MPPAEGSSSVYPSLTQDQYASLFRKRPQMAAGYLRRAFIERKPNLPDVLGGIGILIAETVSERTSVFANKFIETLMTLMSDKSVYEARELRSAPGFLCYECSAMIMGYLASMIESLVTTSQSQPTDGALLKASERILKLVPRLCRTLWDYRKFLCYDREILEHERSRRTHDPSKSFAESSGICVLTLGLLYEQLRSHSPAFDSFHPHVLLFVWIYGPKYDIALRRGVVSILASLIIAPGNRGMYMNSFVKDTISKTDATKVHPDHLSSCLIASLQSPEEVDEILRAYFIVIHEFSRVHGTFTRVRSNRRSWGPGLAESMCIACQRQLCSGDIEFDDSIVEMCIRTVFFLLPPSHPPGVLTLMAVTTSKVVYTLVGRGLVVAAKEDDENFRDLCACLLHWHTSWGDRADRIAAELKLKLSRISLAPWGDILAELRMLDEHTSSKTAALAIRDWKSFGASIGFKEASAEVALQRRQDYLINLMESGSSRAPGCCWFGCMCASFGRHHPLRMCKGCQTYVYCSRKCQEKDWNEGHRDVCTGSALSDWTESPAASDEDDLDIHESSDKGIDEESKSSDESEVEEESDLNN